MNKKQSVVDYGSAFFMPKRRRTEYGERKKFNTKLPKNSE